jgi:acyl-CoA thioester hydrolase
MHTNMGTDAYKLRERLRVRWSETDAQGIVFNGHYLTFFDIAITEYWRAIGLPYPAALEGTGVDLFAVKSTVEYLAPARYDDWIEVGCHAARIGRSSIAFDLAIWRDAQPITKGEVVYVCADPAERRSVPVPDKLRQAIAAFEGG